jgi:hypothetical protein
MRVQFTIGERHSIIRFVRTDPAWFQGGCASSPTKHTSKPHHLSGKYDRRYDSPDFLMDCLG